MCFFTGCGWRFMGRGGPEVDPAGEACDASRPGPGRQERKEDTGEGDRSGVSMV